MDGIRAHTYYTMFNLETERLKNTRTTRFPLFLPVVFPMCLVLIVGFVARIGYGKGVAKNCNSV